MRSSVTLRTQDYKWMIFVKMLLPLSVLLPMRYASVGLS